MTQPRILVGVTGGIAAYKAAELVRALQQRGAEVRVAMTRAAQQFIQPLTFSSITGHQTITTMWAEGTEHATGLDDEGQIEHISVAQWADVIVIAPATAHFLAKLAHGLADDFLSTALLAATAPVVVAPAMNVNMWNHPATQANVATLRDRGVTIVEPGSGYLACGMTGSGRLAEVPLIADAVMHVLAGQAHAQDLAGETVVITAGGTREAIDPVRYIGNRSSGKMGYALAEAARQRGARVVLVSAPTALTPPQGCAFIPVTSAEEMRLAVLEHLPSATVVIGAAAVADFRPPTASAHKIRREGSLHLELEPTADILREVAQSRRPETLIIAFAAELGSDLAKAREKLLAKGADAIVHNDVSRPGLGFDSDHNAATILTGNGIVDVPEMTKRALADRILDQVLALRAGKPIPATSGGVRSGQHIQPV